MKRITLLAMLALGTTVHAQVDNIFPPSVSDVPDALFKDTNNDGIDGMRYGPIYVAPAGDDANPGTQALPMQTVRNAIVLARLLNRPIYLQNAAYPNGLYLYGNSRIYGGFVGGGWFRAGGRPTIAAPGAYGAYCSATDGPLTLFQLLITTSNATSATLPDAVGALLQNVNNNNVTIENCAFFVGNGANAANGANGSNGIITGNGTQGTNGSANANSGGVGGAGGTVIGAGPEGGRGGDGGFGIGAGAKGDDGEANLFGPASGAGGLGGTIVTVNGSNGVNGVAGLAGSKGVVSVFPFSTGDNDGNSGDEGGAGGGGGGGAGAPISGANPLADTGGGGGGGGAGGDSANGGNGGVHGGCSIGIWADAIGTATLDATNTTLNMGNGGNGGVGGNGGIGGVGALGGNGGFGGAAAGDGGRGGNGGRGGDGGPGAGGSGGWSVGIVEQGVTVLNEGGVVNGAGGAPGAGGAAPVAGNFGLPGGIGATRVAASGDDIRIVTPDFYATQAAALIPLNSAPVAFTPLVQPVQTGGFVVSAVGPAANGVTGRVGDQVRYFPNAGFVGIDSFEYQISNPFGAVIGTGNAHVVVYATFAGRVNLQQWGGPNNGTVTVEFRDGGGNVYMTQDVPMDAAGNYVAVAPSPGGPKTVRAKVGHWLSQERNFTTAGGNAVNVNFSLKNGDVDEDDEVSILDYIILSVVYDKSLGDPGYVANADLDGDNVVSILDYLILSGNYELAGPI